MRVPRLRSVLYVPGANGRALEKARELTADALILDLEDAVAPEAKQSARDSACAAAASGSYAPRIMAIRVNAIGTPWHEADLAAVAVAGPDAVVVPKVRSPDDILAIERALDERGDLAQDEHLGDARDAVGGAALAEIAAAGNRLNVLVLGTNDLLAELRAQDLPDRRPLELSLMLCLLAARPGRVILDGVHNDLRDSAGFEAECVAGRQLGFDGKTLIHPSQIDVCNGVFSPSEAELEHARRVIAAFAQGTANGGAIATLDGRLIENLHVQSAQSLLAQADPEDASN